MSQSKQHVQGDAQWTPWLRLDQVALPLVVHTGQTLDQLGDTLLHMQEHGWLRFGCDEAGALYFQTRMDQAARMAALLDDVGRARRN